jgi:prefoldin subunit 5
MLDLYDLRDGQVTQLRVAVARFDKQLAELTVQREALDQAIEQLSRTKDVVAGMLREKERDAAAEPEMVG